MELTFEAFRQKMTNIMEKDNFWDITENNENRYVIANKKRKIAFRYDRDDLLTKEMNKKQETPCLVFQKKKDSQGNVVIEMIEVIHWFKKEWVMATLIIKQDGEICQPSFLWTELCHNWSTLGEVKNTEELKEFEQKLLQCVRELPEFRLYAVTGMLEEWE